MKHYLVLFVLLFSCSNEDEIYKTFIHKYKNYDFSNFENCHIQRRGSDEYGNINIGIFYFDFICGESRFDYFGYTQEKDTIGFHGNQLHEDQYHFLMKLTEQFVLLNIRSLVYQGGTVRFDIDGFENVDLMKIENYSLISSRTKEKFFPTDSLYGVEHWYFLKD